jgi:hypothetical protein
MRSEENPIVEEQLKLAEVDLQAAWRGEELSKRPDWLRRMEDSEVAECLAAARRLADDADDRCGGAELESIMPTFTRRLQSIQFDLENRSGATLLRGFPLDEIEPATVPRLFVAAMSLIGTPVPQTVDGAKLFHVRDEGFAKDDPRARGPSSRNRLTFHSDRCDVIAFLCIQDAKRGGESEVVSSVALFETVKRQRPDLLRVLMEPFWYKRHNVDPGNEHAFYEQPVFSFCKGRFASSLLRVLIDRAYAEPQTPEMSEQQREALDLLESLACQPEMHYSFRQKPGDILLLNNFVTLHRRTEFEDDDEPQRRRHLLRLWLAMPNSRPLDPAYQASYGETEAGAVRGGMRTR